MGPRSVVVGYAVVTGVAGVNQHAAATKAQTRGAPGLVTTESTVTAILG
jgi:hypothetical protein